MRIRSRSLVVFAFLVCTLGARTAFAGPPLLCFPFDVGAARTLPMGPGGWHNLDPNYDATHLVDDTLAALRADTPILVRMETIRRATMYAAANGAAARALLARLDARAKTPGADPLARFDYGYLVETFRQAKFMFTEPIAALDVVDGYKFVLKALDERHDPAIEFAAAVITQDRRLNMNADHQGHLRRAAAAAKDGDLLATNLQSHFGKSVAELRR